MIRINLLRAERKVGRRVKAAPIAPSETVKQLGFLAVFLAFAVVCGYLWLDVQGKKSDLETRVRQATQRREKLKQIKELVDRLEIERERLSERLDVLTNLKDNLRTPLYPVFFIYDAQLKSTGIILEGIKQGSADDSSLLKITLSGESTTDENLNSFLDTIARNQIVTAVDIVSASNNKFTVDLMFLPLNMLSELAEAASEPDAGDQNQGSGE